MPMLGAKTILIDEYRIYTFGALIPAYMSDSGHAMALNGPCKQGGSLDGGLLLGTS